MKKGFGRTLFLRLSFVAAVLFPVVHQRRILAVVLSSTTPLGEKRTFSRQRRRNSGSVVFDLIKVFLCNLVK
ncbi:hypothetical protein QYF36_015514 [Acer negundo]|nr:hypothetical protein QYF36_015514 [Acer negundo]